MRSFANTKILVSCVLSACVFGLPALRAADASASTTAPDSGKATQAQIEKTYGDLPLSFEENRGQTDAQVRFLSRGSGYSFFLTSDEAVLALSGDSKAQSAIFRMRLEGASVDTGVRGQDQLPGTSNYFVGQDPRRWRAGVSTFRKVAYENIYPGISLVYYGNQRQLEYDFTVAPGADPASIRLAIDGAQELTVSAEGNLILHSPTGEVRLLAPRIYQEVAAGKMHEIKGQWTLAGNNIASFRVDAYDKTKALVIDPVLTYSSFLGGTQKNTVNKIVVDSTGNAYVAGFTAPGDFPAAPTPQAMTFGGGTASRGAFVAKIDTTGSNLLYSTYLSGSADEEATGLAVDAKGNVYVAGYTHSPDFPVQNAFQPVCATDKSGTCADAFLTKISATGDSLIYSTYFGGSGVDTAKSLAIDSKGNAYLAGTTSSLDFPTTAGSLQTKCGGSCAQNAFVAKFDPRGTKLSYATYLGGSGSDLASDIALDAAGNVYLTGQTTSPDFPLSSPFQKSCAADATSSAGACVGTAFVSKIKTDGSALVYSTYLGGSLGSLASGIAVDSKGNAYVTGSTQSSDFPVLKAFQKSCGLDAVSRKCSVDIFLTKLAPAGNALVYSTYLGGSGHDEASGVAVDASGRAHLVGYTESANFPISKGIQSKLNGTRDAFAARFNPAGSALEFSTYHGGSSTEAGASVALDAKGSIYLAGQTSSTDFPTSHPFQSSCAGACTSSFVSKMDPPPQAVAPTITSPASASFLSGAGAPASSFTVTTTGTLPITIDDGGITLPTNLTFTADSATGTAVLAGTPTATSATSVPITFTATNTAGNDQQSFTLSICPGSVTIPALDNVDADGTSGSFTVTMTDGTCAWSTSSDSAWLTITGSGSGSGSGTFSVGSFTGGGTSRTGNFAIVGSPFPVTQFGVQVAVSQVGGTAPVEVGQSTNYQANVTHVGAANQGVTWTLTQGGNPCSPGCGTVNNPTANPVTYTAPASTDPASPPTGVTITATSAFDGTKSDSASITVTDYTISISPASGSATQGQSVSPSPTITGSAFSSDGYTGTLAFACAVSPSPAGAPTCNAGGITIPSSPTTSATISTSSTTPTGPYTITFTATDGKAVSHKKTFALTVDPAPVLAVQKSHTGTFSQGGTGVWNITVSNTQSGSTTNGTLTVTDTLPTGYTLSSFSGTNWSCIGTNALTCTDSTDTVAGGSNYPVLSLTVNIPSNSPTSVSNTATASGGGALSNASGSDNNVPVTQVPASLTATSGANQSVPVGNNFAAFSATVKDAGSQPIQGVTVTFTVQPVGGASCAFGGNASTSVTSDVNGVATTTVACTANATAGSYSVQASVSTAGVSKPSFPLKNTDFSLAFSPTSADIAPNASPAVTITATAINGYSPTSLTVGSCTVGAPVTCAIGSPITVGTPANVTLSNTGTPGIYTVTATVHDSSTVQVSHQATFTLHIVLVTISTTPPATVEVNQTVTFAAATAGLTDTSVNWSLVGTNCSGAACGAFSANGPNTSTNYLSPSSTQSGLQVAIKATSNGDATFSAQTSPAFPVTDFSVSLPGTAVGLTQGTSGASQLTASAINGYAGTIVSTPCSVTPASASAPTCSVSAPAVPGSTPINIATQANTSTGLYSISVTATDSASNAQSRTTGSQSVTVQCGLSLGSTSTVVPSFTPVSTTNSANSFMFGVVETAGGSNCTWGQPAVGVSGIPAASSTGIAGLPVPTSGTINGVGNNTPVTFQLNPLDGTLQQGSITVPYFDAGSAGFTKTLTLLVDAEADVTLTAGVGTTGLNLTATQTGTLTIPNIGTSTNVCSAVNANGPDPSGNNFGISCTAQTSGNTAQLSVTVSSTTPASQGRKQYAALSFAIGLPAIVFLGVGASALAPNRRWRALRRITSVLGILLVISVLVLLPACGGGFQANFSGGQTATYTLTVMGYVTDASSNVSGIEVFTVPLNIVK